MVNQVHLLRQFVKLERDALTKVYVSQDPFRMFQRRVPVGPASPGFSASTGGRLMWATSVADARPASLEMDAPARRVQRQVCDF